MPKRDEDVAKELGLGGVLLVAILLILPLFLFAIPFYILARSFKKPKAHLIITIFSLIVFAFCMIYRPFDYFGLYLHLPFGVSFLEELLQTTIAFTNVTWVIYISGGVATSYIWDLYTRYIRSKKVHSIEEEEDRFRSSDEFKKVYKKRHAINARVQKQWRKDIQNGKTDQLLLGINQRGKPYYMDFKEINQHMFVPATTGGGKTVLLLSFIEYASIKDYPIVFIDGKGSLESIDDVKGICDKYQRNFKLFSFARP